MEPQCKKQKLEILEDSYEKDPEESEYFDPQSIPIEIWHQIILYITFKDLLNLSLVCRTMFESIESLPASLEKIRLKLNETTLRDEDLILKSFRSYKDIKLINIKTSSDMKICSNILNKFKENLRILEFSFCNFTGDELSEILEVTQQKLRTLKFWCSIFKEDDAQDTANNLRLFQFQKLQKLEISLDSCNILNVLDLMPDTLLEVKYESMSKESQLQLLSFLERQKNLKQLTLWPLEDAEFLKEIKVSQINFKLDKLEIGSSEQFKSCENFDIFLKSQAETLKELSLSNISVNEFYDSFKNMPNLQLLRISMWQELAEQYEAGPNFNCPSLKTLEIEFWEKSNLSYWNFISRFSNIKKIYLVMKANPVLIKTVAQNYPNIETLVLERVEKNCFDSVSFKNLKELEILNWGNNEFEAHEMDFEFEESTLVMKNLEILKLGSGVLVTATSLLWILVTFKKLKHLQIENGLSLRVDLLCIIHEFFKNLEFLEILDLMEPVEKFTESLAGFPNLKFCVYQKIAE